MHWAKARFIPVKLWLIAGGPWVAALGYAGVLAVALALQSWPGFRYAEWKLYDQSLKLLRKVAPQPVEKDVVVIAVDEASFSAFEEPFALWHKRLGALVDALVVAQPAVVGMDIVLPAKSFDAVVPGMDRALMLPLLRARGKLNLVVAQTLDDDLRPRTIFPGFVALIGAQQLASVLVCFDEDSVVRRVMSAGCGGAGQHQGLAERMAAIVGAPARGPGLIDFRSGPAFTTVSMAQVLRWQADGDAQRLRDTFGGKPVLVGIVLPLEDRLRVPVALFAAEPGNARVPGVMLHGQILRSLLNGGYIQAVPRWLVSALTALVCLCWFGYGLKKNLAYWTLFAMLPAISLYALWLGYSLSAAALLVSAKLAYVARQGLESMRLKHQRARLKEAFAGHVSPSLLQRVLTSDQNTRDGELAPQRLSASVLWVQLAEANAVLASQPPEVVLSALAAYFDAVQQAVQAQGGMVDRLQGGGVLAYFGMPLALPDAARSAVDAAQALAQSYPAWVAQLPHGDEAPPRLAMGIATGPVVAGQVVLNGSSPFVVQGEPLELAMRLAGQAAAGDVAGEVAGGAPVQLLVQVLVCEATAAAVGEAGFERVEFGGTLFYSLTTR